MIKYSNGLFCTIQLFCKLGAVIIGSILVATLMMVLVYSLPTERMFDHVKESEEIYSESSSDFLLPNIQSSILSKPTEAIMLNNALYDEKDDNLITKEIARTGAFQN